MQFTHKSPGESIRFGIDFSDLLDVGETLVSAVVSVRTVAGAVQAEMLSGAYTISGGIVRQLVSGGVLGTTYKIVFTVTTSTGQILTESADFRVASRV